MLKIEGSSVYYLDNFERPVVYGELINQSKTEIYNFAEHCFTRKGKNQIYLGHFDPQAKMRNYRLYVNAWNKKLVPFAGMQDLYITINEFQGPRKSQNTVALNGLFLDLESPYKHRKEDSINTAKQEQKILDICKINNLPQPLIVHTGSGMHLHWIFHDKVYCKKDTKHENNRHRWKSTIKALQKIFADDFLVDKQACALNQYMRLPGGIHGKTGQMARVLHCGEKVDFEHMHGLLVQETPPPPKKTKNINVKYLSNKKTFNLNYDRINDIIKLINMRWQDQVPQGYKNRILFIVASILALQYHNYDQVVKETVSILQDKMPDDWIADELHKLDYIKDRMQLYQSIAEDDDDPRYSYKNDTIIDLLDITPEEQQKMKTLISSAEKQRRRRQRENWISTNEQKHKEKSDRKQKAREMRELNFTNQQIADCLGVNRRTVRSYFN